ncbi:PPOX class F420-dependent oxidoreductase [Saccharopolyspora griseoalba]|uniref:PPOX class F420-dependent oxidoreductase n=1 Tax=Saccharopolyspora griseoalba TaxID=1431848 RepID=A0ABW2LR27_9PSEU
MSKPPLPSDAIEMLRKANPSVITTLRKDGTPVSTPTWYLWDGGRVMVNLDAGRVRLKHMRNDPRVTLSVMDSGDWYTHVTVVGRVVEFRDDDGLVDLDALAHRYLGQQYPNRDNPRVSAFIEIDRWHGWGSLKDNDQPG